MHTYAYAYAHARTHTRTHTHTLSQLSTKPISYFLSLSPSLFPLHLLTPLNLSCLRCPHTHPHTYTLRVSFTKAVSVLHQRPKPSPGTQSLSAMETEPGACWSKLQPVETHSRDCLLEAIQQWTHQTRTSLHWRLKPKQSMTCQQLYVIIVSRNLFVIIFPGKNTK